MHTSATQPVRSLRILTTDVLVLGSGAAGYQAAGAAARGGASVCIVGLAKGASPFILGFNACLENGHREDSIAQFDSDVFQGGYEIADPSLVQTLATQAREAFIELQALGVPFETNAGRPALRHLSGSKYPRSVYVKSGTGNAILSAVSKAAMGLGVKEHLGLKVMSLIKVDDRVCGALAWHRHTGELTAFLAGNTVMAMGGIGGLYSDSTYPADVGGDSYALALDAGATLVDMEFVQFEPTVVSTPPAVKGMEMPTAMLGDGAIMKNTLGERFMCRYNPPDCEKRIEKAKMALCIQTEIDEGRGTDNGSVYFDATGLSPECLQGYVTHFRRLVKAGVDPSFTPIQIHPAAHSLMGGVKINAQCHSGIEGLFVCGEASGGVHGASRIAGNGAADAIVFGRVAGRFAQQTLVPLTPTHLNRAKEIAEACFEQAQRPCPVETTRPYLQIIPDIMASKVGIRRSGASMRQAVDSLRALLAEIQDAWDGSPFHPLAGARTAALVGLCIAASALRREESRGAHFRTDFPTRDDKHWKRSNLARLNSRRELVIL